jgi:hypothetical protein
MHHDCLRERGRALPANLLQTYGVSSVEHSPEGSDPAKTLKVWQRVREIYRVVRGRDLPKRAKENGHPIPGQA